MPSQRYDLRKSSDAYDRATMLDPPISKTAANIVAQEDHARLTNTPTIGMPIPFYRGLHRSHHQLSPFTECIVAAVAVIALAVAAEAGYPYAGYPYAGYGATVIQANAPAWPYAGYPYAHAAAYPYAHAAYPAAIDAYHGAAHAAIYAAPHYGPAASVAHHAGVVPGATSVTATRGAVHVAPLPGHAVSQKQLNLAPAPGTL
uniref:Cuticle protein n=1 Tax=Anopheles atroparvus TaxID=41427 RepID=A0A182IKI3_ANOAO